LPSAGKVVKAIFGTILIIVGIVILIFAALLVVGNSSANMINAVIVAVAAFIALFGLAFIAVGAKFV